MSIRNRLIGFALLTVLLMLGLCVWLTIMSQEVIRASSVSGDALRHHLEADMMHESLRGDVLAARLAGMTKDAEKKDVVLKDLGEHIKTFNDLLVAGAALPLDAKTAAAIADIRPELDAYIRNGQATTVAALGDSPDIDAQVNKFMDAFRALEIRMRKVSDIIESNDEAARAEAKSLSVKLILLSVLLSSLVLVAAFWIARSITRPLNRAVTVARSVAAGDLTCTIDVDGQDETAQLLQALKDMQNALAGIVGVVRNGTDVIANASTEIAAGNLDLSERTERQAGSLQETASAMEELTSTVKRNADSAEHANTLAASASEVALKGGTVVLQVVDTMGAISESSRKITDIIGVIDGIAFQTNILALNAAVEAARAGEQGRGFAVVASEVRSLAQRSASAAKDIKTLIGSSTENVNAGARLVEQAGNTMDQIVASVQRVADILNEITTANSEQTSGIQNINMAISQIDQVTQQNAALVEEAASAAKSLQDQARDLSSAVSVFKLDARTAQSDTLQPLAPASTPQMQTARLMQDRMAKLGGKRQARVIPIALRQVRIGNATNDIRGQ